MGPESLKYMDVGGILCTVVSMSIEQPLPKVVYHCCHDKHTIIQNAI